MVSGSVFNSCLFFQELPLLSRLPFLQICWTEAMGLCENPLTYYLQDSAQERPLSHTDCTLMLGSVACELYFFNGQTENRGVGHAPKTNRRIKRESRHAVLLLSALLWSLMIELHLAKSGWKIYGARPKKGTSWLPS